MQDASKTLRLSLISGMVFIVIINIVHLVVTRYPLFFDEAQYWLWSTDLAWGYYSKPPVLAAVIAFTTSFCGEGESCIRLGSPLLHAGTALLIYGLGKKLFGSTVGLYAAFSYLTLPATILSSSLISTDPALLFCWALTLFAFIYATETDKWQWWLLAAVAAGLGMLSKYSMLIFLFSTFIYLPLSSHHKRVLTSYKFWTALIVAFLLFLPNILWNVQHGFVSFLHTKDNAHITGFALHFDKMLEFVGGQFGVMGPVFFGVFLLLIVRMRQYIKQEPYWLLFCFSVPFIAIITIISLLSRAHANWAAPTYIAATLLVVAWLVERQRYKLLISAWAIHLVAACLFYSSSMLLPSLERLGVNRATIDPFKRLYGNRELAQEMMELQAMYPNTVLMTDSRKLIAPLIYYVKPHPFDALKWDGNEVINDHYEMMHNPLEYKNKPLLLVSRYPEPAHIISHFEYSYMLKDISISVFENYQKDYSVWMLKTLKK